MTLLMDKDPKVFEVMKSELTSGNTSGAVYVAPSSGAVFMKKDRTSVLKDVEKQIKFSKK